MSREVRERRLTQGVGEQIVYRITTTPWGAGPSDVVVRALDVAANYADVAATVLTGSAAVVGDVITLPVLGGLTAGKLYRIEVQFTCASSQFVCWFEVQAER